MSETVAYHESGHVLMAVLLGGEVQHVTIEPDDDDGPRREGDTKILWRRAGGDEKVFAKQTVQVCLAGPVAEMIYTGEPYHPGFVAEWSSDWELAFSAAKRLFPDDRLCLKFLEDVTRRLYERLQGDELWPALAALADNLAAHETLDGDQVLEILQDWLR